MRDVAAWTAGCLIGFAAAWAVIAAIPGDSPVWGIIIGLPLICGGGSVALDLWGDA